MKRIGSKLQGSKATNLIHPPTQVTGLIVWLSVVVVMLVGGLGTWITLARLETAVLAPGEIVVDGRQRTVQHLEGGMVQDILVREGQRVSKGDLLVRLDGTRTFAQIAIIQAQYAEALARDARLAAEYEASDKLTLGTELLQLTASSPQLSDLVDAQRTILLTNRNSDNGSVGILLEQIEQSSQRGKEIMSARATVQRQLEIIREDLVGLETLYEKGLLPRQRYFSRLEDLARLEGALEGNGDQYAQVMQEIAANKERIQQIQRDRRRSIATEQQDVRKQVHDLRERLVAMEDIARRLEIRAPGSGRIIGLAVSNIGEVISEGTTILQIVPDDADLVVAARVSPDDIDEVQVGSRARIRLAAYSARTTAPIEGRVRLISPDRMLDETSGRPYYAIEVTLDHQSVEALPDVEIIPGLSGLVMVRTGSETILTYLLDPLLRGVETAMIESY